MSRKLLEQQRSMSELTRVSEDLKLLLSRISATQGIESSLNDISPRYLEILKIVKLLMNNSKKDITREK